MSEQKQKQKRNVVFRRVHGRIIPISLGAASVAAGLEVGKEKHYSKVLKKIMEPSKLRSLREFSGHVSENKFSATMAQKYKKAISANKVSSVISYHHGLMPWENRTSLLHASSVESGIKKHILIRSPSRFSFLHELGHAKLQNTGHWSAKLQSATKNLRNFDEAKHFNLAKIMKWSHPNTLKRKLLVSKPGSEAVAFVGKQVRALGGAGLAAEETMAWVHGAKYLRTPRQKIAMLKSSLKPLSSYLAFPAQQFARAALVAGGVAAIGYGLMRRGKNAKSK